MCQCSSTDSTINCLTDADSLIDLAIGSSLGCGSGSGVDTVAGSGSGYGGGLSLWSVAGAGSGCGSMAGMGVVFGSRVENLSGYPP